MTGRVAVVGSVNTDLVVRVPRFPRPGETLAGRSFATYGGGKGANQAIAAARAGAVVRMVGAVGDDAWSRERLDDLRAAGIDTAPVHQHPGMGGIALIQVDDRGENAITIVAGANAAVQAAEVAAALQDWLEPGDVVCCQLEIPVPAIAAALRLAGETGAHGLLNAAPMREEARELLDAVAILVVNEVEAGQLLGEEPVALSRVEAAAAELRALGPEIVAITLGKEGAFVLGADRQLMVSPPAVEVLDTTGAGDAFVGAFATMLALGEPLDVATRAAVHAGALAVTRAGAQPSLPTREEIERSLGRQRAR